MKWPSLMATEDAIRFFASMVWILPLMRMTSGSGCWLVFARAGAWSMVPPAAAAAPAAAVLTNLRRLKLYCLRLSRVISNPLPWKRSLVEHHRLGETVEKPARVVPHQREGPGNDDRIARDSHRHFRQHLGELLGGARHAEGAIGWLRAQQEVLLRHSRLERHHEALELHLALVEGEDLLGKFGNVAVFLPRHADLGQRFPGHHGRLVVRGYGLERKQQCRGRGERDVAHRSPPLKNGVSG